MLEVHDRMHRLWKQQREALMEEDDAKSGSKSPSGVRSMTLEAAAKAWLAEEEHWEKEQESNLSLLYAVADDLFSHGATEDGGGASLLCFDEVQVSYLKSQVEHTKQFTIKLRKSLPEVETVCRK